MMTTTRFWRPKAAGDDWRVRVDGGHTKTIGDGRQC
jgi:hypothetical protein